MFGADDGKQIASLGIGMVATQAEAAGIGSLPRADVGTDKPLTGWMWRSVGVVLDDASASNNQLWRIDEDMRSQRKVMYGAPVLLLANQPGSGDTAIISFIGIIRCLYLQD